jgi:hypothetical protein
VSVTTGRWTWGALVTTSNQIIPFDRGGTNKTGTMRLGYYTVGQLADEAARAMNAGDTGQTYTCVFDFSTRKFTFDNGATAITLEWSRNTTTNAAGLFGFDDADTSTTAAGITSTSAVGAGFSTLSTWAPSDPSVMNTPITAQTDGSSALLLGRKARTIQQETDGGLRESIYFSTDKVFTIEYRMLSASEQTNFDALLVWLEKGAPVDFRPDDTAASTVNCRFVMAPAEMRNSFSWTSRTEADYPALQLIQQLSRT